MLFRSLKTATNGSIIAAVAGTDYVTGAGLTAAFPFTPTTNFGAAANSTSTPLYFTAGLQASSTSQIAYASTTAISAASIYSTNALLTGSSTIGDGTQAGGLTISGGATTTGNLAVQGSATSTFSAGISATNFNLTSATATSTAANGINLTAGCFAVNGTCVGGGGSAGGAAGQIQFNDGSSFAGASQLTWDSTNNRLGIGTTTPWATLSIHAGAASTTFAIGSSTSTYFVVDNSGKVGIGTASPGRSLDVYNGSAVAQARLSYNASNYAEMFADSVGDLYYTVTGGDIHADSANLFICASGACPALGAWSTASSTQGSIHAENAVIIGDGFSLREIDSTSLGLYNTTGGLMVQFDTGL